MSSPKEKAIDIRFRYWKDADLTPNQAKLCAWIAVDEILKDREEIDGMRVINDPYWSKVKQEIEKL